MKNNEFFTVPADLHPNTANLIARFASAMAEKLHVAEQKYGYSDGWASDDWMDECRQKLAEHIAKGDPRDVAAYCAFLWHHGERTTTEKAQAGAGDARELLLEAQALIRAAEWALGRLGLRDRGSDCSLSHEVRMFALDFSAEGRDGPGALQVRGTGRSRKWWKRVNAALSAWRVNRAKWTLVEIDDADQVFLTPCWSREELVQAIGEGTMNDGREYDQCDECNGIADELIEKGVFHFEGDRPIYLHNAALEASHEPE